jgi:YebC/PmpR family DNA-binding regulatory protein
MAGHSKWANIKHRKGAADAKRAKVFSKFIKELTIAARMGGSDPDANPRLRLAIDRAKGQSMPKDNIERAIKKGAGELEGAAYEEISYEGYGQAGVALVVDCTTDNKNRTVAEIRHTFSRKGGNLGESGSVAWMFEKKGVITIEADTISEEELFEKAIEAGAEDLANEGDFFTITTSFEGFHGVNDALQKQELKIKDAEIQMVPKNTVKVEDAETAGKVLNLIEALEDNDDVQNVWANFDIDDAVMEKLAEE